MIDYAKKIKEYREKMFLTQANFAKILGVSIACVPRWESGIFKPTTKVKKKIYKLFVEAGMKVEE